MLRPPITISLSQHARDTLYLNKKKYKKQQHPFPFNHHPATFCLYFTIYLSVCVSVYALSPAQCLVSLTHNAALNVYLSFANKRHQQQKPKTSSVCALNVVGVRFWYPTRNGKKTQWFLFYLLELAGVLLREVLKCTVFFSGSYVSLTEPSGVRRSFVWL